MIDNAEISMDRSIDPVTVLRRLLDVAIAAAHPNAVLPPFLAGMSEPPTVVIGAGKGAGAMAQALEARFPEGLSGIVVVPHGYGVRCRQIEVVEAAHPVPDATGQAVAQRIMQAVTGLSETDRVVMLLSGGGSSLLGLPAEGITLSDKQAVNRALLRSGATISEMNCVRKHLSAIKGGRLAKRCWPASIETFAISDVPGDDPSVISSGPTVADPTTSADALEIFQRYGIAPPDSVVNWLHDPRSETLKDGDPFLSRSRLTVIATPQKSLDAAARMARAMGYEPIILGDLEGESRDVAKVHAGIARQIRNYAQPLGAPCVILSGGETTVTVRGKGRGGRNTEFLLSLTNELRDEPGIWALAADTDGIDGSENNAGAITTPTTYARSLAAGMLPRDYLTRNDGYGFFDRLDDLVVTGPSHTNVNDFRAILIAPTNKHR